MSILAAAGHVIAGCPGPNAVPTDTSLNPGPCAPPGLGPVGTEWLSWAVWFGVIFGIGGFIACGIMMAAGRRNRSHLAGEGAAGVPWVMAGMFLIAVASTIVGAVLPTGGLGG
jgi:hypothetical protein